MKIAVKPGFNELFSFYDFYFPVMLELKINPDGGF